jgi:hypothetical protein
MAEPQANGNTNEHLQPPRVDLAKINDVSVSILFEEDEETNPILLKYTESRSVFLTKVSLVFMIYFALLFGVVGFVYLEPKESRILYRNLFLHVITWEVVAITCFFKIVFSCFGNNFTRYMKLCFLLDCVLSMIATLGIFFELDNFIKLPYIYNGHYLFIFLSNLLLSSIIFFLTTLYRNGPQIYNVVLGVLFMSLGNWVLLHITYVSWPEIMIQRTKMIIVFLVLIVWNFYVARNSYTIVNFRTESFYEHEHIRCFYSYSTDWFSFFWFGDRDDDAVEERQKMEGEQVESQAESQGSVVAENP